MFAPLQLNQANFNRFASGFGSLVISPTGGTGGNPALVMSAGLKLTMTIPTLLAGGGGAVTVPVDMAWNITEFDSGGLSDYRALRNISEFFNSSTNNYNADKIYGQYQGLKFSGTGTGNVFVTYASHLFTWLNGATNVDNPIGFFHHNPITGRGVVGTSTNFNCGAPFSADAPITASATGTTLTVTGAASDAIGLGYLITGTDGANRMPAGVYVTSFGTGTGGTGTYTLSATVAPAVSSTTLTARVPGTIASSIGFSTSDIGGNNVHNVTAFKAADTTIDTTGQSQTITSGTYVSGTGVITLTMAATSTAVIGNWYTLAALTGTGGVATLIGTWLVTASSGTSITLAGPAGAGASTITGGTGTPNIAVVSGTYDSPSGKITVIGATPITIGGAQSVTLSGMAGTGAFAALNGTWTTLLQDGTNHGHPNGTTLVMQGPVAAGAATITGGVLAFSAGSVVGFSSEVTGLNNFAFKSSGNAPWLNSGAMIQTGNVTWQGTTTSLSQDYTLSRAMGAVASVNVGLTNQTTFSASNTNADVRGYAVTVLPSGSTGINNVSGMTASITNQATATIAQSTGVLSSTSLTTANNITLHRGFRSAIQLSSSGNAPTMDDFLADAPTLSSTGTITTRSAFNAAAIGHATLITNAYGFRMLDTSAVTAVSAFVGEVTSGTGKRNLSMTGTADNILVGKTKFGASSVPASYIDVDAGTVTASTPAVNIVQTWNSGAVVFTGLFANFTSTASSAASLVYDFQVSGSSVTSATRGGVVATLASGTYRWAGQTRMLSPADGILELLNNGGSGFTRIQLGGTTSSFPALAVSSATLQAKLADNSAFTFMQAQLQTSVAATTGLVGGALAATTNASIVIYDSTGQAYRVPCII